MSKGSSGKVKAVVPVDSRHVASASKFKRCKVSVIRDFLLGCGWVTAPNFGSSELITVNRSGQGSDAQEFLVLYVIKCVSNLIPVDRLRRRRSA
ncbi:hypothetical protein J1N35_014023 [Gossypium stocksii]|uniref:Uncharacterized protein n=1 Tax=Gossypium stocksii TaxID=47602 RepID=A0A9D4A9I8_9ROSI|nr:hypothetical protein J1N35_014023 [Gossypium stocksii]